MTEAGPSDVTTWEDSQDPAPQGDPAATQDESVITEPSAAPPPLAPDPLSGAAEESFVRERLIGVGSLGRVYASRDERLGREVACKELALPDSASLAVARGAEARFLREARVTARLEHPNIVPIYFAGRRWDGTPFYAMKMIKGRSLRAALSACETLDERLGLLERLIDVAQAMAFAHARGVIHRDLKPENVMLGQFGETWVVDWGLARVLDEPEIGGAEIDGGAQATRDGTVLGTPAYMPPEQARGLVDRLDARSDVWSLGAMLFELLTGEPPHGRGDVEEVLRRAKEAQAPWLERAAPDAPPELRAIASQALRRVPDQRYPHAGALLEDLQAYRGGQQVGVYSYSTRELLGRFWERQRLPILVAAAGLVLAIAISAAGFLRVLAEREVAEEEGARARAAEAARAEALSQSFADKARSLSEEDPTAALLYAAHALQLGERPFARGVWAAHASRRRPQLRFARRGPTDTCRDLAASGDGRTLACVGEGRLLIWDVDQAEPRLDLPTETLWSVALSENGQRMAAAGPGLLRIWDGAGQLLYAGEGPDGPSVAISEDGAQVFWVEDHRVHAWGAAWAQSERVCGGGVMAGLDVHGDTLVLACAAGSLWLLDARTGQAEGYPAVAGEDSLALRSRAIHDRGTWTVSIAPDGRKMAIGGLIDRLFLWDLERGALLRVMRGHESTIAAIDWSADSARIATASKDGDVRIWDAETGRELAKQSLFALPNSLVAFHANGWTTLGRSGVAQDWQLTEATLPDPITLETGIETLVAMRDGARVLAIPGAPRVGTDHVGVILDASTGAVRQELRLQGEKFITASTRELADGRIIVPTFGDYPVDPESQETRGHVVIFGPDGAAMARVDVPFMPQALHLLSGERLAVVLGNSDALAWDLETGALGPWTLGTHRPTLRTRGKVESADGELNLFLHRVDDAGERLMFVEPDGQLWVAEAPWDAAPRRLRLVEPEVRTVALSGDGRRAALAGRGGQILVWDLDEDALVMEVGESGRQWSALDFSPSGRLLAAGNRENRIRIWDVETGALLAVIEGHAHWVTRLAFLDEERLVSGSWDNSVRVWDLSTLRAPGDALVQRAERETGLRLEGARVALIGAEE